MIEQSAKAPRFRECFLDSLTNKPGLYPILAFRPKF
jgi:hypothetical protein